MKVLLTYNTSTYLYRFRRELIEAFQNRGFEVVAATPADDWSSRVAALGVRWIEMPLDSHGLNPARDLRSLGFLYRKFRDEQPDIVLNFTIKPVIYGSIAARMAHVPVIASMMTGLGYAFMPTTMRQRMLKRLILPQYRLALSFNDVVFFQNPDDRQLFLDHHLVKPLRAVRIHGSGVNLAEFIPAPDSPEPKTFLLVARLLGEKGIREYAAAAAQLKQLQPNARFLLLGPFDSNPSSISRDEVSRWEREGTIQYLGTSDDVRPYLRRAEVFVLPSYREGTPRSVLEAMAMGKPIVTFDVPGCRETVRHNVNGFLVRARDIGGLASAMGRFLSEPGLAARMGRRSREYAEECYDVRKVNAEILTALLSKMPT